MEAAIRFLARALALARPAAFAVALGIATGLSPAPALGAGPEDWHALTFRSIERETRYVWQPERETWLAEAECSASARVLPMDPPVDPTATPILSWRWRVLSALENPAETRKAGDDFAARVSVLFRRPPDSSGLLARARRRAARLLYGADMPHRALHFVWSSQTPVGSRWPSPYTPEKAWVVAASTGPASQTWREIRIDVAAEAARAFPDEVLQLYAVAVMTDSDNLCVDARAEYGRLAWGR